MCFFSWACSVGGSNFNYPSIKISAGMPSIEFVYFRENANAVAVNRTLASMGKLVRLKDFFMPLEPPDQLHLQGADGFKEW
jgi:hypothetical protein